MSAVLDHDRLVSAITVALRDNRKVHRVVPPAGRLHVDRQLPFLLVYRRPEGADGGTDQLVTSEASYLVASGLPAHRPLVGKLLRAVVGTLSEPFGAFLVVELWSRADLAPGPWLDGSITAPAFSIVTRRDEEPEGFLAGFTTALARVRVRGGAANVSVRRAARCAPEGMRALLSPAEAKSRRCTVLGLEVRPVYRSADTGRVYPAILRDVRRGLTRALRRTFHDFACHRTSQCPMHFQSLGPRALVKAVWEVDRGLADVADSFDFLLQVTPANGEQAWSEFQQSRFERTPVFHYRAVPTDTVILKRRLFATPVERIEDPALAELFRGKLAELDRQITMLDDVNTRRFVRGSVDLFGQPDDTLLGVATQLLERLPARARDDSKGGFLDVEAFSRLARRELGHYRRQWSSVRSTVQIRPDIGRSLMVSSGALLIGSEMQIPASRAVALLQHEVGTHVLTYFNGRAQPLRLLHCGLPGYDALQEGLAVFSEYLAGGLSRPRLRLLAGRVVATRMMLDGASFVEAFRRLTDDHGFEQRTAFVIARRVYRGGGLTKDAVYLRGLCRVLDHVAKGGAIEPLLIGKIAVAHLPIVRELQWREVLRPAPLRPRWLDLPGSAERLRCARKGMTPAQLVEESAS